MLVKYRFYYFLSILLKVSNKIGKQLRLIMKGKNLDEDVNINLVSWSYYLVDEKEGYDTDGIWEIIIENK